MGMCSMSKQRNNRRDASRRRLATYLAAGAGSIGMVSATEAAVVSIDLTSTGFGIDGLNAGLAFNEPDKTVGPFPTPSLGIGHFYVSHKDLNQGLFNYGNIEFSNNNSSFYSTDLKTFGSNSNITAHSTWKSFAIFRNRIGGVNHFASNIGPNQYLGFRVGSAGNYNYGYFELTWDGTNYELLSAAYNDQANEAMFTPGGGGGGAVPEPASGAIAALLMGGAALRQWRKKRRQESNEAVAS